MIYTANMFGQLIKIKPNRKLLVKVDQKTFDRVNERYTQEMDNNDYENEHSPLWATEDGDFFITLTLDKYDRFNMRKFEALIRCNIIFTFNYTPYAFTPVGADEEVNGVTLTLTTIRRAATRAATCCSSVLTAGEQTMMKTIGKLEETVKQQSAMLTKQNPSVREASMDEILRAIDHQSQNQVCRPPSVTVEEGKETEESDDTDEEEEVDVVDVVVDDLDREILARKLRAAEPLNPLEAHLDNELSQRLPLTRPPLVRQNGFQEWLSMAREIGEKSIHRRRAPPS